MKTEIAGAAATPRAAADPAPAESKAFRRLELFNEARGVEIDQFAAHAAGIASEAGKPKAGKSKKPPGETVSTTYRAGELASLLLQALPGESAAAAAPPDAAGLSPAAGFAAPRWRLIGPTLIPNGQTYGSGRADVSGRVSCVAIDPSDSAHILCGAAGGGVWESRNGGAGWSPRTDAMPSLATGAIAFDPTSPNLVYVGTGEGDFYAALGAGVLVSNNGGTSWRPLVTAPFVGVGFHALLVDPDNGGHMLAGTTVGLFESNDRGLNWTRRRNARTWSISRAEGGAEILASCADGLFGSTDGGATWTAVGLPTGAPSIWDRLAVHHVRSQPAVAYAFGAKDGDAFLYRRNAGAWTRLPTPSDLGTGQAWYDWYVAAAPDRTNQVYLGAINLHRGDLSGSTWNWTNLSAKPAGGDSIHPDQHNFAFDPSSPNVVYATNDGGLYRSSNRGVNWQSLNSGLAITEFEYIDHDPGSTRWLMGGTQDNGTNRYGGGLVWDHIADGDGGDCAVIQPDPDTVYHSFFRMGFERSDDRGQTWRWFPTGSRNPNVYRQLFYPPLEANGDSIAQAGESVFVSRARGAALSEVALPNRRVASAMSMPNPNLVYVGTTGGNIYRTTWNGSAWSAAAALSTPRANAFVSDLFVDPADVNRIWATYSTIGGGRVFRSDDGGANWTDVSPGLPDLPMNAVEVHPGNRDRVWVAADLGVYQSFDRGATWRAFSNGLPNALIVDLRYHRHSRLLRAATRNRGIWQIRVDGELTRPICGRQFTGTVPANATRRWFTHSWPAPWHVIWTVMPTTVRSGAPQIEWNIQVERANAEFVTYWITVKNLTSTSVAFEGRYCITSLG